MTQDPKARQFNWPSSHNPDYTREKDAELARLYGGRDDPGYIHRVLGKHGSPQYAVFNLDDYLACVDPSRDFSNILLRADETFSMPYAPEPGHYYLGCDLGYAADPSEFVVYLAQEPHYINVLRVQLRGVHYNRQQAIIIELDQAYDFQRIAIDAGNAGRAVAHNLMALGIRWCDKLHTVEFGGAIDLEPFADHTPDRRPTKEFMTELLQQRMAERSIVFPQLPERESQYASHTYALGFRAKILYEKGNDHLIDADRCATLARYLDTHDYSPIPLPPRILTF